mgnify:CR=1 FL=1
MGGCKGCARARRQVPCGSDPRGGGGEKEIKKLGIKQSELFKPEWVKKVIDRYNYLTLDDMYASVGFGGISATKIIARLLEEYNKEHEEEDFEEKIEELAKSKPTRSKPSKTGVVVKLSKCCNPLPGDEIVGYITKGRGVSVHRTDCVNTKELLNEENRMIEVSWFEEVTGSYSVELEIFATDRNGLLKDIFNKAKEHLQNKNLSIGEISQMMKFNDIYSFSHFFKRNSGMSPLQYRKQFSEKNTD